MKTKKRILPLLLIMFLLLSSIPFLSIQVSAGDWEPCAHCGEYRSPDYLCDSCGGCGIETCNDCFLEHHCPCGACELDIPICNDCRQCLGCVGGFICSECDLCPDCVGFDEYCTSCYKCAACMGMGYCYECNRCGDCTDLCTGEDCHRCHDCCDRFCENCGLCDLCAYDTFCNDCGLCGNCFTAPLCSNCGYCSDCATVCECEQCCENCASLCRECEKCENCVELCHGCGEYCSECRETCTNCGACEECQIICEECGDYCDGCSQLCQECNKCTECVDLCHNCGEYCSECRETCANCGFCEECADICKDCGEVCTDCGDLCSDCGEYCSECRETCTNCGACEECQIICEECGDYCDGCSQLCQDCNKCENCVHLCHDCKQYCFDCKKHCNLCDSCEECANICKDCGEVCDGCADFCLYCNKCEHCVNLCSACEQVCENCEPFCQGCNTGACCAYICPNCGEFCTECQSDWTYKSLDNIQHQWQCSCGAPLEEPESHCFIYEVRKAATATEAGFGELKCDLCNYKERVAIPATGSEEHSHNFSFWVSELSSHEMYCACGANDPLTKGAHEFQWVTDIEATIGDPGLKHQECTVCGYQLPGETIPRIDHTHAYETTWSSDYTGHWHACSCGHKSDEASHAMGEWIVTSAPTETKPGSKERVCNICNYKQTLVIPSMATNLTVTFYGNGGSSVTAQSVVNGGKAVKPENPSRPGYVFTGWYTTASGTTVWNFEHAIYEATTLYARWALEETPEPPAILTESLKQAFVGSSYNEILQASGSAPITWSIIDGKLPNGLILNSTTGKISGKPTEDGLFSIVIIAENKYDADIKSYTLTASIKSSGGGGGGVTTTTYTITTNAGIGGSIDSDTTVSVKAGENIKFNIKPNQGYAVEDVKVDGKSVGAVSDYEFTKVNANHTIFATFKKIEDTNQDSKECYYFTDVDESEWYFEPVMMACDKGLFSGTSDTTFSPYMNTTRGMIVTILHRLEGTPKSNAANVFTDVGADKYYTDAVAWASDNIIVSGYGNGMFGPEDSITREQMAVILMNYAKYKGYDISMKADLSKFADGESISPWAKDAISWANAEGLIQGSGSQLMPVDNALRCQVAAILQRFIETIAK